MLSPPQSISPGHGRRLPVHTPTGEPSGPSAAPGSHQPPGKVELAPSHGTAALAPARSRERSPDPRHIAATSPAPRGSASQRGAAGGFEPLGGGGGEEEGEKRRGRRVFTHLIPADVKPRHTPCWSLGAAMRSSPKDVTVPGWWLQGLTASTPDHGPGHSPPLQAGEHPEAPQSDRGGDPVAQGQRGTWTWGSPAVKLDDGHRGAAGGGGDSQMPGWAGPASHGGLTDAGKEALLGAGERSSDSRGHAALPQGSQTERCGQRGTVGFAPPETCGERWE